LNPGLFRLLLGDFEVLSESSKSWSPIKRWTMNRTDAAPGANTWGFRAAVLDGRPAIEVSNDGTSTYLERGESLVIG